MQKTFANAIEIKGIGLHGGLESKLLFKPAPADSGIVFVRTDTAKEIEFPALYSYVVDTRNCTCLGGQDNQIVSTIEHVMAALAVAGVDNTRIEINNPEVPIMDGSAKIIYDTFQKMPLVEQTAKRKYIRVLKEVSFSDGKGGEIVLKPESDFSIRFEIDFPSKVVGHQVFSAKITREVFANQIAPARTFCEKYQVDYLRSVGLIKGGSLENAVVLDGETILNEGGFRIENECVNHKVLDCIGDMFTAGFRLRAAVECSRTGHYHNNEVLKALFSNPENYEIVEEE